MVYNCYNSAKVKTKKMANQVLEIIKQRHQTQSQPGKRSDPHKVVLCVEGGGLRGVVSAGALAALEALGYQSAFDVVYGSSCGAYGGVMFVAGDCLTGTRFYLDYSQKQFISIKRFLRGGPIFDLDYVSQTMHGKKLLDYEKAIKASPPLHIVATDANSAKPYVLKNFKNDYELDRALKATSTFPLNRRVKPLIFHRHHFLDGYILDPFCLHGALKEQATHIMIIFSKPWRSRHPQTILDKKLLAPYFSKISPNLAETYLNHGEYSVNGLSHIWNHYDGTHVLTVSPHKDQKLPSQLTRNRKKLGKGYLAGAESVLNQLSPDGQTRKYILDHFKSVLHI